MHTYSKRQRLASLLDRAGLLRLLEWWRRPGLLILAYHRITSSDGHLLDDGVLSATARDFEAQLGYLRRHFDLPGLETILQAAETGSRFNRPTALVTFDDGYRDNVDQALPILQKAGVPAVFFICPRFVTSRDLPFWDRLAYVFKKAAGSFSLDYPFPYQVDLDQLSRPRAVLRYLAALCQWPQRFDEQQLFEHVEGRAGVQVPVEALSKDLFADWDGVRRLAAGGMAIGSHSMTHPFLPRLPEDEQRHELTRSKAVLEEQIGQAITTVAYPDGQQSELTRRLAREAGYRLGFSYPGGRTYRELHDCFDVARIPVDADVVWPQFRPARLVFHQALGRAMF